MQIRSGLRKALLTSHVTFSLGWFGAVAVFFVLAITALISTNTLSVRSAFIAMETSAWFVVVPFCIASLTTGILQALGTKWGLFKHYWIVVKLLITTGMTFLLLLHMQPISYLAGIAKDVSSENIQNSKELIDLITKSGAAMLVLIVIATISVYKPWGKIQWQKQNISSTLDSPINSEPVKKPVNIYLIVALIVLVIIFVAVHLHGKMMNH